MCTLKTVIKNVKFLHLICWMIYNLLIAAYNPLFIHINLKQADPELLDPDPPEKALNFKKI